MVGGTTQAMAAPAVRRERHDTTQRTVWGLFMRRRICDRGLFSAVGKEWAELVPDPFTPHKSESLAASVEEQISPVDAV